jgi:hypothetical protein
MNKMNKIFDKMRKKISPEYAQKKRMMKYADEFSGWAMYWLYERSDDSCITQTLFCSGKAIDIYRTYGKPEDVENQRDFLREMGLDDKVIGEVERITASETLKNIRAA